MAQSKPMPHPNEDPANLAARQAAADYTALAQKIRGNFDLTDLDKAQRISDAYDAYCAALQAAYTELNDRRRARLDQLEQTIPTGPGIPEGTSPADKAVLMAAFRSAMDKALAASPMELGRMLADAERFDDDAMRRAVLTVAADTSQPQIIRAWSDLHTDMAGFFDEVIDLRTALAGINTMANGWAFQDFRPMRRPDEVAQLPGLIATRDAAKAAFNRSNY